MASEKCLAQVYDRSGTVPGIRCNCLIQFEL